MVRVVLIKNSMRVWRNIYVRHILQGHNDIIFLLLQESVHVIVLSMHNSYKLYVTYIKKIKFTKGNVGHVLDLSSSAFACNTFSHSGNMIS